MDTLIVRPDPSAEFRTNERCSILEVWKDQSDPALSIARARVSRGVTTQLHRLRNVDERYIVVSGTGSVRVAAQPEREVLPGDIVAIPAGTPQQIANTGEVDLIFYCVCTPPFTADCYESLEQAIG